MAVVGLTAEYLNERHGYWLGRIAGAGIWDAARFAPVFICVRPRSRTRRGAFIRRYIVSAGRRRPVDRIFIYRCSADMDANEIDNILVHEMIHQYIVQSGITDNSPHGRVFTSMMQRINYAFASELNISVSTRRSAHDIISGPGSRCHTLLVLEIADGYLLCRVHRNSMTRFMIHISQHQDALGMKCVGSYESHDICFDSLPECRTRLRGLKISSADLGAYCERYGMVKL